MISSVSPETGRFPILPSPNGASAAQPTLCVCLYSTRASAFCAQLERMRSLTKQVDLLIADGGSTDGAIAPDVLSRYGVRALLTKRGLGKLGAQMRMALAYAMSAATKASSSWTATIRTILRRCPRFCNY